MHVIVSVAIIQLEISAALMQVTVSASNMWVTILIVFMQVGVSIAIMQVVLSALHKSFYGKMLCFCYSYIGDTLKYQIYIPFSNTYFS